MKKANKKNDNENLDISIDEKVNNLSQRFFNVKLNEKNHMSIDKSIKSKKLQIYDILKEKLLKQKDFIVSRNIIKPSTLKTKKIRKNIKFSKLQERIEFGTFDYLNIQPYTGTKNQERINLHINSLLKSQHFNFRPYPISKKMKKFVSSQTEKTIINNKKFNKTVLGNFGLNNKIKNKLNDKINQKDDEINNNYFNTENSKISNENNYGNNNSLNNIFESLTPRHNMITIDSKNESEKKRLISPIKKNVKLIKDINSSNSFSESINQDKKPNTSRNEKNIENMIKNNSLNNLLINYLNDNNSNKKIKNTSTRHKTKKNTIKYNYIYRKSFISKNNEKVLKQFQKYAALMDKENNKNNLEDLDEDKKQNNIFEENKKKIKEKLIKNNFYKFGSKSIYSLINIISSDQIELNNKLFKIIDRSNKKVRKEKKLDEVLEIILEKKLKKKKKVKAKEIFIDAQDGKKLLEERNKLRFMMRFADLIKDMNDEMALNLTKNIIGNNQKLKNDFILPELVEYKKLQKLKHLEKQNNIRNRLKLKLNEIETKTIISGMEKDNLYSKYEKIFKKNKMLKEEKKYINLTQSKQKNQPYHNIEAILSTFDNFGKEINE